MDGFAELIERKRQGSLKVYLGYAAGVGKTYAMLQEGLRLKQQHVDGTSNPTTAPRRWRSPSIWKPSPPANGAWGTPFSMKWTSRPSLPANRRSCWWTSWPTPTRTVPRTTSATRMCSKCWRRASTSFRPSTCSIWNPWRRASKRPPASPCGNASRTPCCGGPIRSSTWT